MPRTLTFSGSSDDLFCVEEHSDGKPCGGDETSPSSEDSTGGYKVANDHGGLFVVGTYAPRVTEAPCWSVGVMPLDEDVALPDWPMHFETAENGYSSALVIEVPEDAYVKALAIPRD